MKIGLVVAGMPPFRIGGAEIQAWELAKRLAKEHPVILFTRHYEGMNCGERDGVRIISTANLYGKLPRPLPYLIHIDATVRAICREIENLDVLLCFTTEPGGIIGSIVKKRTGLPFCVSIRGGDWYFVQPHWIGRFMLKKVFLSSNRVIVQTPRIRDEVMRSYPFVEPVIIPNGIEIDQRIARGNSLIFLGNLLWRKGVDILLEVLRNHPEIPAVIGGEGPEREKLEKKVRNIKGIKFVGAIEAGKGRDFMVEHGRIFVLPSIAGEGMPNVLLEAMSVGLPVVATDVAGVRDIIEDGINGMIVPPADSIALEKAIVRLWNDEDLREKLSAEGKRTVLRYSWEKVVKGYIKVLNDCIKEGRDGN